MSATHPVLSTDAAANYNSRRLKKSTPLVSHDPVTGIFTVAAGFLDELAPLDIINFSALTGGSGIVAGADYHLLGPRWNRGQTTFKVSVLPNGPVLTGGTAATVATVSTGELTVAEDGVLSSNIIPQDSPLGR